MTPNCSSVGFLSAYISSMAYCVFYVVNSINAWIKKNNFNFQWRNHVLKFAVINYLYCVVNKKAATEKEISNMYI